MRLREDESSKYWIIVCWVVGRDVDEVAHRLNVEIIIMDTANAPAKQKDTTDPNAVRELAKVRDFLIVEIEHVDTVVLET